MIKSFFLKLFVGASLFASFAGCIKEDKEQPCEYDACASKATAAEVQSMRDYLTSKNIIATEHCSGLFYRIENEGTGKSANACSYVFAQYKGMLTNGNVFDESSEPIGFSLTRVIQGWTKAVPLIKEGGRIILYIPASLAYGNQEIRNQQTGAVEIPANSHMIFEVNLVAVQ